MVVAADSLGRGAVGTEFGSSTKLRLRSTTAGGRAVLSLPEGGTLFWVQFVPIPVKGGRNFGV